MFVDASAFCAVLNKEPEREVLLETLLSAREILISPIVVWECVRATVRHHDVSPSEAEARVWRMLDLFTPADIVAIGRAEQRLALDAFDRFGKGHHPARLNMGDCFAYACAKANGLPLLFKGDDFSQTDIAAA
jgi:ribonuclease VapC